MTDFRCGSSLIHFLIRSGMSVYPPAALYSAGTVILVLPFAVCNVTGGVVRLLFVSTCRGPNTGLLGVVIKECAVIVTDAGRKPFAGGLKVTKSSSPSRIEVKVHMLCLLCSLLLLRSAVIA